MAKIVTIRIDDDAQANSLIDNIKEYVIVPSNSTRRQGVRRVYYDIQDVRPGRKLMVERG
jgi:hypothetical protein